MKSSNRFAHSNFDTKFSSSHALCYWSHSNKTIFNHLLTVRDSIEGEKVFHWEGDEPVTAWLLPNDGYCQAPGNKTVFYPTKHFYYCEWVIIHPSYGDKKPPKQDRNVSQIIDTVFHDECIEEINNLQEEYCDYDDECTSSVSDMNSTEGE